MKMSRVPLTPRESLENRSPRLSSYEDNVAAMKGLSPRELIYSGHVRSIKSRWEKYADSAHEEKCNSKSTRSYTCRRHDEKGQENTCFQSRSDSLSLQKVSERNMIGRNPVARTYVLKDNPWMKKSCNSASDEKESTILKGKNVPERADDPDSSLMSVSESRVSIPWKKPDLKVDCTRKSMDNTWTKKVNNDEEAELEDRVLKGKALPGDDSPASAVCEKYASTSRHYTSELTDDQDSFSMSASGSTASLPRKKPDLKVDTTRKSMDNAWVKKDNNQSNDKTADRLTKKETPASEEHNSTNYKINELSRCISSDSSTFRHYIDKFADVADCLSLSASGSPTSLTRKKPDLSVDTTRKSMSWSGDNIRQELSEGKLIGNMLLDIHAQNSSVENINGTSGGTVLPSSGSVDSSTSSLVYSVGNTIESYEPSILQKSEKTYQYFGSNSGARSSDSDDDVDPSKLIASTLAECRLLLQMSPPPTPLLKPTSDQFSYSFKEYHQINKNTENAVGKSMDSLDATTLPSLDSKTSSFAFSKLGRCPSCDEYIQEEGENTPLRSVLCGHVVCHKCIFSNTPSSSKKSIVVDCPECEVKHDLDHWKPVLGMGLNGNSKEIDVFHRRKPSIYHAHISSENKKVPTQIHLFSPSNKCHTSSKVTVKSSIDDNKPVEEFEVSSAIEATEEGDTPPCPTTYLRLQTVSEENESKSAAQLRTQTIESDSSHCLFDDVDRSISSSGAGNEPITPVSRAEFRFLQQKQKLAQSLEQINQILQKSKSRRDQLAKDVEKKTLKEEMEVEMGSKGFRASEISYENIGSTEESNICCDEKLGDPFDVIKEKVRKKVEAAFQEQYKVENEESAHDQKELIEFTICQIDCQSRDITRVSMEKDELSTVAAPTDQKIANRRRLPQLSIDTGFGSNEKASEKINGNKPDTSQTSNDPKPMDRLVTSQNDLAVTIDRNENNESDSSDRLVFRTEDGCSVSDNSSFSGRHDENAFLISDKHKIKLTGNTTSKIKECIATPMGKSSRCHQNTLSKEKQCHQFLPSLNYSILQDTSRFENKGNLCAQNKISVQKRLEIRRKTRHESMSITQGTIGDVFRHNGLRSIKREYHDGTQWSRDTATCIDQNFTSTVCDGRNLPHARRPTYEFSEASSLQSLFDDEEYGGLNGELVTHKPKLRKKILGKLGLKKIKKK